MSVQELERRRTDQRRNAPATATATATGETKSMEPKELTFEELQEITDNFSVNRILGRGTHGLLYRGLTRNGVQIAVEKLYDNIKPVGLLDKQFQLRVHNLSMLQHPNILRFISYCYEFYRPGRTKYNWTRRALCFEYLQCVSLERYLSSYGVDWHTSYKIIKGTCEGLCYLHEGLREPMYHLDLAPANILLDVNMVPKIAYFGLSMLLGEALPGKPNRPYGTRGYRPPEYLEGDIVTEKFDVFSLGVVMINVVTGCMGFDKIDRVPPQNFFNLAQENWRKRLQATCSGSSLELYCQQVKRCTQIALDCMERDMHKRPSIGYIISKLNEMEVLPKQMEVAPGGKAVQNFQELFAQIIDEDFTFRMDSLYVDLNVLECTISGCEMPSNIKLPLLQLITKNFSDEQIIGHGGCGVVYKGILPNGIIAVKRLFNSYTIDDKMFHQEVKSMMMVTHQNTVRLLGYCSHTEEKAIEMEGKFVMAQIRERLLCFEYISNGSLTNHLSDELRGLPWHTRYQIIKGICEGLHHLHKEKHIIHMDLKPANILLDDHMVPKITDFGLSRPDNKSQTVSAERLLSLGYCAPEYQHHGKMSAKSDIYSLGVIILEMVAGTKQQPSINEVFRRWKHRWKSARDAPLWYQQMKGCLYLAQICMHKDPTDRPNIWDVIGDLNKMDSSYVHISNTTEFLELEDMLGIEPLEMHLPFKLNKKMSYSIELTNNTDDYFAFRISTTSLHPYDIHPDKDIVRPQSKCTITITLQEMEKAPPHNHYRDEFSVQSTRVDESLTAMNITGDMFHEEPGKVVDTVNFIVVLISHDIT